MKFVGCLWFLSSSFCFAQRDSYLTLGIGYNTTSKQDVYQWAGTEVQDGRWERTYGPSFHAQASLPAIMLGNEQALVASGGLNLFAGRDVGTGKSSVVGAGLFGAVMYRSGIGVVTSPTGTFSYGAGLGLAAPSVSSLAPVAIVEFGVSSIPVYVSFSYQFLRSTFANGTGDLVNDSGPGKYHYRVMFLSLNYIVPPL